MPDIPWSTPTAAAPDAEVYVMASRFETATLAGAVRFFLKAPGIILQMRKAPAPTASPCAPGSCAAPS